MEVYRPFIDDSGTREYDPDRNYETSGRSRYFVYGSLLLADRDSSLFAARLQELKELTFNSRNVEIKSNWLRIPHERTRRYIEPYGLSDERLSRFVDDYYRLGDKWEQIPDGAGALPMYDHFKRIARKFYQDTDGRVQGFGIVKFPLKKQVRWRIVAEPKDEGE